MTSTSDVASLKDRASAAIDAAEERLVALSEYLHRNPELSFEEVKAAASVCEVLESHGFRIERPLGSLPTSFRADLHSERPHDYCMALLAEYDALPDLGHACGHNLIASWSVGAAIGVASVAGELPASLAVIGTPAEEVGGGKVTMIREGVFRGIDAAMMIHPQNRTLVDRGSLAVRGLRFRYTGQAAHASSWPERGRNALEAVIMLFVGLNALRQHARSDVRIHGIVTKGGKAPNIVPDLAEAEFFVRARDGAYLGDLVERVRAVAEGAARMTGTELEVEEYMAFKERRCNQVLAGAFAANLERAGIVADQPPTQNVGSSDIGDLSHELPAIHPYLAICGPEFVTHSKEFAEVTGSEAVRPLLPVGAKLLAHTAIDVMCDTALQQRIREEHMSRSHP